jgi:hypothetical protein
MSTQTRGHVKASAKEFFVVAQIETKTMGKFNK